MFRENPIDYCNCIDRKRLTMDRSINSKMLILRAEIPDGDDSVRGARFRDGKSGRAAAAGALLPDC